MKKTAAVILAAFMLATKAMATEYVLPPETMIGGTLLLASVVQVVRASAIRVSGPTRQAHDVRRQALTFAGLGAGFISMGWITATYYDRRFGIKTEIQF